MSSPANELLATKLRRIFIGALIEATAAGIESHDAMDAWRAVAAEATRHFAAEAQG